MPVGRAKSFFDQYTSDLKTADLERLFTRDTAEAYRFFTRHVDTTRLDAAPWYRRWPQQLRLVFHAFSMRLSPARRALYGVSMAPSLLGLILLFRGFAPREPAVLSLHHATCRCRAGWTARCGWSSASSASIC